MIHLTEMSGIMAFIWSSIFIMLIYYIRKREDCFQRSEMICIVFLYIFSAVRLILPIDFIPSIGIDMPDGLSQGVKWIFHIKRNLGGVSFTIAQILSILWILGTGIKLLCFLKEYGGISRWLSSLRLYKEGEEELKRVQSCLGKKMKIDLRKSEDISSPLGFGVFHKIIVLPEEEYEGEELFYILLHECQHFLNGDCMVKVLVEIYRCIFWWNPFTYYLQKDLERHQEISCDLSVVKGMPIPEIQKYLQTIVNVLKKSENKKSENYIGMVSLTGNTDCELAERFQIILENQKKEKNYKRTLVYASIFAALFVFSYSFMPRPRFAPPKGEIESEDGYREFDKENSYIYIRKNGEIRLVREGTFDMVISKKDMKRFQSDGFEIIREE